MERCFTWNITITTLRQEIGISKAGPSLVRAAIAVSARSSEHPLWGAFFVNNGPELGGPGVTRTAGWFDTSGIDRSGSLFEPLLMQQPLDWRLGGMAKTLQVSRPLQFHVMGRRGCVARQRKHAVSLSLMRAKFSRVEGHVHEGAPRA